jgi:hypothetical protein
MAGEGKLNMFVWPTYAGVLDADMREPVDEPDYQRAPINWELVGGILLGRTAINAPVGEWPYVIYAYEPWGRKFLSFQRFSHPFVFRGQPGVIEAQAITEHDVRPKVDSHNGKVRC